MLSAREILLLDSPVSTVDAITTTSGAFPVGPVQEGPPTYLHVILRAHGE